MMQKKQFIFTLCIGVLCQVVWGAQPTDSPETARKMAADYEHGRAGVKQDYQQAFQLYCKAALQGDAEAAYNMGFMYFNGRGMSRDLALALRWFKQAADAGDQHAHNMMVRYADIAPIEDGACKKSLPETTLKLVADHNPNRKVVEGWVNQIAPSYGIDPALIMAVIHAESAFNVAAVSNKNAQGLMQLIPETARRFGVNDSWDPIQNIKGGTAYLHWLLRHFDGKVDLVLAAYNAGEGAVERYHGIPPYRETQNYVKQILARYSKTVHPVPPNDLIAIVSQQKS